MDLQHIGWGDVPAWAGAIGTVGALFAALRQIHHERTARQRSEAQTTAAAERWQAERVSSWFSEGQGGVYAMVLSNASHEPVYSVVVTLVLVAGAGPIRGEDVAPATDISGGRAHVAVVPPGRWRVALTDAYWGGMFRYPGVEVAFTDSAGRHWVRRALGALERLEAAPLEHFRVDLLIGSTLLPDDIAPAGGSLSR